MEIKYTAKLINPQFPLHWIKIYKCDSVVKTSKSFNIKNLMVIGYINVTQSGKKQFIRVNQR